MKEITIPDLLELDFEGVIYSGRQLYMDIYDYIADNFPQKAKELKEDGLPDIDNIETTFKTDEPVARCVKHGVKVILGCGSIRDDDKDIVVCVPENQAAVYLFKVVSE